MSDTEDWNAMLQESMGLPGLKARAEAAAAAAASDKAAANADCYAALRIDMYRALVYTLDVDAGTAAAACDKSREGTKSCSAGDNISERDENLAVRVTVDGLNFRGHYERKKIMDGSLSGEKKEFKGEDVYDDEFVFEWQAPNASVHKVTSLAHLGTLFEGRLK